MTPKSANQPGDVARSAAIKVMCVSCGSIDEKYLSTTDGGDIRDKIDMPETGDAFQEYPCDCDGIGVSRVLNVEYSSAPHGASSEQEDNDG